MFVVGGEKMTDFLENVANYETHLVGHLGLETTFTILPSPKPTFSFLAFYDADIPVSVQDFSIVDVRDEDL